MDISLVNIDVRDLSFENKVQGTQELEMETNVQYSVNIAANIPQCRGEAWLTVQEKSSAHLVALKLHVVGVFNYTPTPVTDEVKRELHEAQTADLDEQQNHHLAEHRELGKGVVHR